MKPQVIGVIAALVLTGCGHVVDGAAAPGHRAADPGFFFAGDAPVYGQTVSNTDAVALAYLQAMRRIDVCGFVDRAALSKIGDITSVATLYALDECDLEVKLPNQPDRRFLTVALDLTRTAEPVAFRGGGIPVYESAPGSCEYLMPLDLSALPGATRLRKPAQPYLRLGQIGGQDCGLAKKFATAVSESVGVSALPARDAAATYPVALAERDPCEVLSVIAGDVDHWDINETRPYACEFGVFRDGDGEVTSLRVSLEPKIVDVTTDGRERRMTDGGAELFLDPTFCSATVFVGPAMQRRLAGGDFVDVDNVVVRPAVTVDGGSGDCAAAVEVAGTAAKLFG